jgi:hypothetical protein
MTDWVAKMKDTVQPRVPETVTAVGLLQPAGEWGAFGLGKLNPLAGMLKMKSANQAAGGLASGPIFKSGKTAVFALTADDVYVFSGKPKGFGWKLGDELAHWSRTDLRIATQPGKVATKVTIDVATGEHYELEATTAMDRGFNDVFLAELARA